MENYGTGQLIVKNLDDIEENWEEGYMITACAARGSAFYVVMTQDTNEYEGDQTYFTCNSWGKVDNKIDKEYNEGNVITGICYSTGLGKYFVVMTETPQCQRYNWSDNTTARNNWMDKKCKKGFHPTIIFKDPTDKKILVVVTEDENRSGYVNRINYKMA